MSAKPKINYGDTTGCAFVTLAIALAPIFALVATGFVFWS